LRRIEIERFVAFIPGHLRSRLAIRLWCGVYRLDWRTCFFQGGVDLQGGVTAIAEAATVDANDFAGTVSEDFVAFIESVKVVICYD
jgi:hypothetical protein